MSYIHFCILCGLIHLIGVRHIFASAYTELKLTTRPYDSMTLKLFNRKRVIFAFKKHYQYHHSTYNVLHTDRKSWTSVNE